MSEKEFSKDKSHEENIKVSIDKILGTNTVIKRTRKKAEDHRKALFCRFIDSMIFLNNRGQELDNDFLLDMTKYDSVFYETIETVLELSFTKKQIQIIFFYLYERVDEDGKVKELIDEDPK